MLEKEFDFFKTNQESLVKKYKGKILVIVQEEVAGIYENNLSAYLEAEKQHGLGNFLIQTCEDGPQAYTVIINHD